MPWSGTEIEIKISDGLANGKTLVAVTRRHKQLGIIYWQENVVFASSNDYKIEFQTVRRLPDEVTELALWINGIGYSLSDVPAINFDFETFENVTLFVNSENKVMNTASTPYVSVTNFYVHNDGNVLIP